MLLFFSILGIFLSVLLFYFNTGKNKATRFLAGFFFLISLYLFCQYVLLYSKSTLLVIGLFAISPIIFPILYLIGPMLFWYVRSILSDNAKFRRNDFFHFLPAIIYFSVSIPFTFSTFSEKTVIANEVVENVDIMQTYATTFFSNVVPNLEVYLSRPLLLLAYVIWSIVLIKNYLSQMKLKEVFSGHNFMIKWLILLLGFVILLAISHIILIIHTFHMNFTELAFGLNIVRILSAFGLIGLMILPFLFPAILYGLPRFPVNQNRTVQEISANKAAESGSWLSHLEYDYIQSIGKRIDNYMKENQPFLIPQFNITKLAVEVEVPVHHLAFYFKEVQKQTFHEYRNEWRIKHAKKLIVEGKTDDLTLEAIATLSGFPNRNSFRSVFKKYEGICPSTFVLMNKKYN